MPAKNIVKTYVEGGYYHIYNRGVEKRIIFKDVKDHKVFLSYLKQYLSPPPKPNTLKQKITVKGSTFDGIRPQPKNYHQRIQLMAYCLMPNHFHLLVRQEPKTAIKDFMHSLSTRFTMYFNKRHNRIGPLFQSTYKAILVDKDEYLLHLSRYIHLNPSEYTNDLTKAYSSYADYLEIKHTPWVNPKSVLDFFQQANLPEQRKANTYQSFIETYQQDDRNLLANLTLED